MRLPRRQGGTFAVLAASTRHTSAPPPRANWPGQAALVACVLLFLAQAAWHWRFTVDDAYISFRYARNWVEGKGVVFNEGERVEGYTSFLWVALIAGALGLGCDPEKAAKILGTLAGVGVVLLGPLAMARLSKVQGRACLLGALALAAWPSLAYWAVGGLETNLFALLLTGGLLVWLGADTASRGGAAGVLMGLATLTRPEAPLFWAASGALRMAREGTKARRTVAAYAGSWAAVVVPWLVWRLAYYGQLLPLSFYVKSGGWWPPFRVGALIYLELFLSSHWGLVFWGLLPLIVCPRLYLAPRAWEAILPLVAYLAWVAKVGDWMPEHRFLVPVAGVWAPAAAAALFTLWKTAHDGLPSRHRRRWASVALGALVFLALLHVASFAMKYRGHSCPPWDLAYKVANYLRPGDTIAVIDAGVIPYYTRARTLDMVGLVSREVAKLPEVRVWFPRPYLGRHWLRVRPGVPGLVLQRRPAVVQLHVWEDKGRLVAEHPLDQLLLANPVFRRWYAWVGDGIFVRRDVLARRAGGRPPAWPGGEGKPEGAPPGPRPAAPATGHPAAKS
jgi:arabinofuranosyltransferase